MRWDGAGRPGKASEKMMLEQKHLKEVTVQALQMPGDRAFQAEGTASAKARGCPAYLRKTRRPVCLEQGENLVHVLRGDLVHVLSVGGTWSMC